MLAALCSEIYLEAERGNVWRLLLELRRTAPRLLLAATYAIGEGQPWLQHPLRVKVTS